MWWVLVVAITTCANSPSLSCVKHTDTEIKIYQSARDCHLMGEHFKTLERISTKMNGGIKVEYLCTEGDKK